MEAYGFGEGLEEAWLGNGLSVEHSADAALGHARRPREAGFAAVSCVAGAFGSGSDDSGEALGERGGGIGHVPELYLPS